MYLRIITERNKYLIVSAYPFVEPGMELFVCMYPVIPREITVNYIAT